MSYLLEVTAPRPWVRALSHGGVIDWTADHTAARTFPRAMSCLSLLSMALSPMGTARCKSVKELRHDSEARALALSLVGAVRMVAPHVIADPEGSRGPLRRKACIRVMGPYYASADAPKWTTSPSGALWFDDPAAALAVVPERAARAAKILGLELVAVDAAQAMLARGAREGGPWDLML